MPAQAPALAERGLMALAQQLPAPSAQTLGEPTAVQEVKREAFDAGATGWVTWNSAYVTSGTTATALFNGEPAWGAWNVTYATAAGTTVMYDVNSNTALPSGTSFSTVQWTYWNTAAEEDEEQRAERERREAESAARHEERRRQREAVEARATELLRSLLSDEQWASYREKGWFEVRGSSGRRWRVRDRGQSGNVDLMPEIGEERDATYCAHPPGGLPDADAHAAQMLALVTDDEAFTRTANRHYLNPALRPRAA